MIPDDLRWRKHSIPRIVLGTAQLGMHYGIANVRGKPIETEVLEIVKAAWKSGIRFFDTAQAYGDSEKVLGYALGYLGFVDETKVVSKLSPRVDLQNRVAVSEAVEESRRNLGVQTMWGMLLHRAEMLDVWDRGLGDALLESRNRHAVKHLGVSVYTIDEARRALEHPEIDVIQIPCNAWDQRMSTSGILALAERLDKLCFVRSIYLQGLLTMQPEDVAKRLPQARVAAERWHEISKKHNLVPVELAMRFALSLRLPLVVGMESVEQVLETDRLVSQGPLPLHVTEEIQSMISPVLREDILDPRTWNI